MKSLFLILLLSSAKLAWAFDPSKPNSSKNRYDTWISTSEWIISKASETYTLDEFVSGGKFCAWRGKHGEWIYEGDPCANFAVWPPQHCPKYKCQICGHERKTISKQVEEFEP